MDKQSKEQRIYTRKENVSERTLHLRQARDNRRKPCPNCGTLIDERSKYCRSCWKKINTGTNHHNWKGRGIIHGYVWVRMPDHPKASKYGIVLEHIFIWEKFNGPLPDGWCVHHINGVRNDNRIENLMAVEFATHSSHHCRTRPTILKLKAAQLRIRNLEAQLAATHQLL